MELAAAQSVLRPWLALALAGAALIVPAAASAETDVYLLMTWWGRLYRCEGAPSYCEPRDVGQLCDTGNWLVGSSITPDGEVLAITDVYLGPSQVVRLSLATGDCEAVVTLDRQVEYLESDLAVLADGRWILLDDSTLFEIDPVSGVTTALSAISAFDAKRLGAHGLRLYAGGAVNDQPAVFEVFADGRPPVQVYVGDGYELVTGVASSSDELWVAEYWQYGMINSASGIQIDPDTGSVVGWLSLQHLPDIPGATFDFVVVDRQPEPAIPATTPWGRLGLIAALFAAGVVVLRRRLA